MITHRGTAVLLCMVTVGVLGGCGGSGVAPSSTAVSPSPSVTARNLRGGTLAADPVTPPVAVPSGLSTGSGGEAARAAGPGNYTGFRPTVVVLPSGDRVAVVDAGVRDDGTLAVPDDPSRVGRWTGGALPGERYGGVVIAGHVDSRTYGLGAFAQLLTIEDGARVRVEGAGGREQRYRVSTVEQVDKARLEKGTAAFAQEVPGRLVLITCGGPFDPVRHHYRDNLVVVAEPVA